ncbi:MAG: PQQ-binding-like beta-propeller repeat protein, partial [Planctomycetota bacterium]
MTMTHRLCSAFLLFGTLIGLHAHQLSAENWPGFRGLKLAGVQAEGTLPVKSLVDGSPKWVVDLGTRDVGSAAVQDGRVFVLASSADRASIRLICSDLETGKQQWEKTFANADNHLHSRNTLASSTPATDADVVVIAHSDREHTYLRCFTHQGEALWSRDFGTAQSQHGFGTSPTIEGETVLLNFSQQAERVREGDPGTSRLIAIDRRTGNVKWESELTSTRVCYGTPIVHDGMVICTNTGDGVYAHSLETGKRLWNLPVFGMRCVSTPIVIDDTVIGSSGSGGGGNHLVAVRMPSDGQTEPTEVMRIERFAPYVPTGVFHEGRLF